MDANFVVKAESFEKDDASGKRKRLDADGSTVFGIRFRDNWCLRYRPPWKHIGASLMVYQPLGEDNDRIWECVRSQEHFETIPVDENGKAVSPAPSFVTPESDFTIGPNSFWGHFTTIESNDVTIKNMKVERFEQDEEDRATMDLTAMVHWPARPRDAKPECNEYYSIRLEMVRLLN